MGRLNPCPVCGCEAISQFRKVVPLQFAYEHCGICGGYRNDWKAARLAWNKTTAEWILEKERTKADRHTATECAYKNGFAAGMKAAEEKGEKMAGKARPSLRKKTLENVMLSNLSKTDKECIKAVFEETDSIVRCKECKHRRDYGMCDHPKAVGWDAIVPEDDDFCSYGERRADNATD